MERIGSRFTTFGTAFLVVLLAVVAMTLPLTAGPARASSPSGVSVKFGTGYPPASTSKAGEQIGYQVLFTATSALVGGTQANDSITLFAPAGTKFPTGPAYNSPYNISDETTRVGYGVNASPILSDNGATATIPLTGNSSINIRAGDRVTLDIGLFGPYVTNPTTAGNYTLGLSTSRDTTPANSASYTITPNDPAQVSVAAGGGQRARVGEGFATPLSAKVSDAYGNVVPGQNVTFTAPSSGPGGAFSGSATNAATTGSGGIATASAFTANAVAGPYEVQASSGSLTPAGFSLTNLPGPAANVSVDLNPASISADGASTTTARATLTDAHGNPVPSDDVSFNGDGGQPIGPTSINGDGTYEATITSTTVPGDSTITAVDHSTSPQISGTARLTQFDGTPPDTWITSGPSGLVNSASASFDFSSSEPGSTFECSLDRGPFTSCASPGSYADVAQGQHVFQARATDGAGNTDPTPAELHWTVDTVAPRVTAVSPAAGAKGVYPTSNLKATFSEGMRSGTIDKTTLKLVKKGATKPVRAVVSYSRVTKKATLNPTRPLARGATYTAVVKKEAEDLAGNPLAKDKSWTFTVKR